jgi:hypothetical protein
VDVGRLFSCSFSFMGFSSVQMVVEHASDPSAQEIGS